MKQYRQFEVNGVICSLVVKDGLSIDHICDMIEPRMLCNIDTIKEYNHIQHKSGEPTTNVLLDTIYVENDTTYYMASVVELPIRKIINLYYYISDSLDDVNGYIHANASK